MRGSRVLVSARARELHRRPARMAEPSPPRYAHALATRRPRFRYRLAPWAGRGQGGGTWPLLGYCLVRLRTLAGWYRSVFSPSTLCFFMFYWGVRHFFQSRVPSQGVPQDMCASGQDESHVLKNFDNCRRVKCEVRMVTMRRDDNDLTLTCAYGALQSIAI